MSKLIDAVCAHARAHVCLKSEKGTEEFQLSHSEFARQARLLLSVLLGEGPLVSL